MTNEFFGEPWPSGVCARGTQLPTPIGEPCLDCAEPIVEGDHGYRMPAVLLGADNTPSVEDRWIHRECGLRSVLGGIGHLTDHDRWCIGEHDPDAEMGRRASALAVWAWIQDHDASEDAGVVIVDEDDQ